MTIYCISSDILSYEKYLLVIPLTHIIGNKIYWDDLATNEVVLLSYLSCISFLFFLFTITITLTITMFFYPVVQPYLYQGTCYYPRVKCYLPYLK